MILKRKKRPRKTFSIYVAKELMERIEFLIKEKWKGKRFGSRNHFVEKAIEDLLVIEESRYCTQQE